MKQQCPVTADDEESTPKSTMHPLQFPPGSWQVHQKWHAQKLNEFHDLAPPVSWDGCKIAGTNILKEKFMARRLDALGNTFINVKDVKDLDGSSSSESSWSEDPRMGRRHSFSHLSFEHERLKFTLSGIFLEEKRRLAPHEYLSEGQQSTTTSTTLSASFSAPRLASQEYLSEGQQSTTTSTTLSAALSEPHESELSAGVQSTSDTWTSEQHEHLSAGQQSTTTSTTTTHTPIIVAPCVVASKKNNLNKSPKHANKEPPQPQVSIQKEVTGPRIEKLVRTQLCKHWMRGYCRKKDGCAFAHSEEELRPTPNLVKTKLCHFAWRGCQNPDCTYAHGLEELRGTPSNQGGLVFAL